MDDGAHVLLFDMEMFKPRSIPGALSLPSVNANHNVRVLEFLMQAQDHFKLVFLYTGEENTIGLQLMELHMPEDLCYSMDGLEYRPQNLELSPYHDCPILTDNVALAETMSDQLGLQPIPPETLIRENGFETWHEDYRREATSTLKVNEQKKLVDALLEEPEVSRLVKACPVPFIIGYGTPKTADKEEHASVHQVDMETLVHAYVQVITDTDFADKEKTMRLLKLKSLMRRAFYAASVQKMAPVINSDRHDGVTEIVSTRPRNIVNPALSVIHRTLRSATGTQPS